MDLSSYAKQNRGDASAYATYFAGMDASMQQKVALTTAYFPTHGVIADMGSGSGKGTFDLACLYQSLQLVGIDINPVSVAYAQDHYQRPNLSFVVGDISQQVLPAASVDGILNSSVFHHITSFNNFDLAKVGETLDNQVAQLKAGGVIIIRDFVVPDGPDWVWLDLPTADGAATGEIPTLSTAALFREFARSFRSSQHPEEGVPCDEIPSPRPGFSRFRVRLRDANEFILRKNYRRDWETELLEEYTYLSQAAFEQEFRQRGLRIINSMPITNPWIVANRYRNQIFITGPDGADVPFPPTNYLIAGEKVSLAQGVELVETTLAEQTTPGFLQLRGFRHVATNKVYELVERPHPTLDVLPWFESEGRLLILAKKDFPRPITNACLSHPNPTSTTRAGYITEPVSAIIDNEADLDSFTKQVLEERAGVSATDILRMGDPVSYFTSPGGLNERVLARLVHIKPRLGVTFVSPNYTPFVEAGTVRELDATQVLRASHVSGMFDARLEINIYRLFLQLGVSCGPWIGDVCDLSEQDGSHLEYSAATLQPPHRSMFTLEPSLLAPSFLSLRRAGFSERNAKGVELAQTELEYVVPRFYSRNTVTALPVLRTSQGILIGLEYRDLPAFQSFTGSSRQAVVPAWRLPASLAHVSRIPQFLSECFRREFQLEIRNAWELGGPYFPTPGVTPELAHPWLVEIKAEDCLRSTLTLIELGVFIQLLEQVADAHLLISGLRAAHALGILNGLSIE
ncbi:MAG: methyltransferase domain-containing protein [Blastocatellia bacterium]|nr:methyltransferase domain-containing protein [Blastocatellia bacterium]